jgi:uncharacterized protein YcaQ
VNSALSAFYSLKQAQARAEAKADRDAEKEQVKELQVQEKTLQAALLKEKKLAEQLAKVQTQKDEAARKSASLAQVNALFEGATA